MKLGTGNTSGSLSTAPRASLDCVAIALSTLAKSSAARRSPEPIRRSSSDLGQVVDRPGIDSNWALVFDSRGSHSSFLSVAVGLWKVVPLRMDMFSNSEESVAGVLAGRRRGWTEVEDILRGSRGDEV